MTLLIKKKRFKIFQKKKTVQDISKKKKVQDIVIAYTIYNIHTVRTLDLISRTHHTMFTSILL